MAHLLVLLLVFPAVSLSAGCGLTAVEGDDKVVLDLSKVTLKNTFEIEWKHNKQPIFKRKNGQVSPGMDKDINEKGGLVLKQLNSKHAGTYSGEVYNERGGNVDKTTITLCVKARVPKPTVTLNCSTKATFTCNLIKRQDITFTWSKNKVTLKGETSSTLVIARKDVKNNIFSCTVNDKDNENNKETSAGVKFNCEDVPDESGSKLLGFPFWVTVGVLAGGGGLVLLLFVITAVCCCCFMNSFPALDDHWKGPQLQHPSSITPKTSGHRSPYFRHSSHTPFGKDKTLTNDIQDESCEHSGSFPLNSYDVHFKDI